MDAFSLASNTPQRRPGHSSSSVIVARATEEEEGLSTARANAHSCKPAGRPRAGNKEDTEREESHRFIGGPVDIKKRSAKPGEGPGITLFAFSHSENTITVPLLSSIEHPLKQGDGQNAVHRDHEQLVFYAKDCDIKSPLRMD
ncbi:unnamed protein product [Lota lota]